MKKPFLQRTGDFLAGKGFYIVLFLCVAAIGISGYYLFSTFGGDDPQVMVSAPVEVVVPSATPSTVPTPTPSSTPVAPTTTPSPVVTTPAPSPSPSSSPEAPPPKATQTALVFTWPVKGLLQRDFSLEALAYDETMNDWRTHSGIDIAAELGTQVLATAAGTVVAVYKDDLMGTTVSIDHGNGLTSTYANLAASPTVELGGTVNTGDVIGAVGSTAIAESIHAAHLHFELSKDGEAVDPVSYLPELP